MSQLFIRKAESTDYEIIKNIYAYARNFMQRTGNPTQWGVSFPPDDLIIKDIAAQNLYVLQRDVDVCAVFYFAVEEDPTYRVIEQGSWLSDEPYGVIHRVAGDGTQKGIMPLVVKFCEEKCKHLRIDTHANNLVMQHQVEKCGFQKRGVIYTHGDNLNDAMRLAYEKL